MMKKLEILFVDFALESQYIEFIISYQLLIGLAKTNIGAELKFSRRY